MKYCWSALLFWFFALSTPPAVQAANELTLDEILDRYYEKMGGLGAIEAISSIRIKATLSNQLGEMKLIIIKKRPNKVRINYTRNDRLVIQAFDGEVAWMVEPGAKWWEPNILGDVFAQSLMRDSSIESKLVNFRKKNVRVEFLGTETLTGNLLCYHLRATAPDGEATSYYLDTKEFVERKIVSLIQVNNRPTEQISYPSDYRRVGSVLVAYRVVNWLAEQQDSVIIVDEVEINPGVLDSYFRPPAPVAIPEAETAE